MKFWSKYQLIFVAFIIFFGFISVVYGKTDNFIISYADETNTRGLTPSDPLNSLIDDVASRFVISYANENRFVSLIPIPSEFQEFISDVADRFILEYANENRFASLVYPVELIGDETPPTIISVDASNPTDNSLQIVWVTDEYTIGMVEYGVDSGVYTDTVIDGTFRLQHTITISGLIPEETYYYRINSTDRSGNNHFSIEYMITLETSKLLFMPLIVR